MAISISEPCHEDWTKMNPTERGAFCQKCTLEVIDFTDKSTAEIKSIFAFEFATKERTCGRITNYQLDQINDDFFKWKNDSDAFRGVWIFSLIAVFGLSLFSCQNTLSKELVNQLNIETTEMLDSLENKEFAKNEVDTTQNVNSIAGAVTTKYPWIHPETMGGVTPLNPFVILDIPYILSELDLKICTISLGSIAIQTLGMVSISEEEEKEFEEFLAVYAPPTIFSPNTTEKIPVPTPVRERTPVPITPRLEGVTASGNKKFSAFIYPNPIVKTSKLYLDVNEFLELEISLFEKGNSSPIRTANSTFGFGPHAVDLKLFELNHGEYKLRLNGLNQTSVLDFFV